jgi:hypothetical protein
MRPRATLAPLLLVVAACGGDPEPECSLAQANAFNRKCYDAMVVALRETATLVPSDEEILAVYEFLDEVRSLSCYFFWTIAQYEYDSTSVVTTNPVLVEPWSAGEIRTGNPAADALFADRGANRVQPSAFSDEVFYLGFEHLVSLEVLAAEVQVLADTRVPLEESRALPNDIRRVRVETDDAWLVTFIYAWGVDCIAGCDGWRQWDVLVPDDGTPPTVVRDTGEEIPERFQCQD